MKKVLLGLVMAMGAMLALTACGGDSPEAQVKAQLDAMVNKDFKAYVENSCDMSGKALSQADAAKLVKLLGDEGNAENLVTKYEFVEAKVADDGKTGEAKVKVTVAGKEVEKTLKCFKVEDKWLVGVNAADWELTAKSVVKAYFNALKAGKVDKAIELSCHSSGKELSPEQKTKVKSMLEKSDVKSFEIVKEEVNDSTARVKVKKNDNDTVIHCKNINGKWYVKQGVK